ncbi:MAG: hypothetical protein J5496_06485 [Lachnospiraceae bacterium]|nr:hypothetical protein [Lachnospiraceae bacterium]
MKQNILQNNFLYRPWEAIRFTARLDREVQESILKPAVQLAATRYPYLCVAVKREADRCEIGFNSRPIPVFGGRKPPVLGSEEANGQYLAVGYEADRLYFDVSHNLCDTKGLVPFVQTVLYLYLQRAAAPLLDPAGIRLPGQPMLEHETEDPYEKLEIPAELQPLYTWKFSDSFVPDRRYAEGSRRYICLVKVPAENYIRFFRTNDGSPVVLTSFFLKETIRRLFPDRNGLPICLAVPHSLRPALLGENNYHDQLMQLFLRYDERTDAMPVLKQLTASRGSLILQMDQDNALCHVRRYAAFSEEIDALNMPEEKRRHCQKAIEPIIEHPETMCVSYAGRFDWGCLAAYIKEAYVSCTVLAAPLFVQITALGDAFWLSFLQRDETTVYAKTFVGLLRENGIPAELTDSFPEEAVEGYLP